MGDREQNTFLPYRTHLIIIVSSAQKTVDLDEATEQEYQEFAKAYYRESILKQPPVDKKKDEETKKR